MNKTDCCRVCGQKRPADAPSGLCPSCLLKAGLAVHDSEMEDVTILFGPASSSVLQAFGAAYGKIPPVLLRDADAMTGPEPMIRPSSEEIPDTKERSARLQIFGEIARGGMGAVLKGRDADLGRDLAVKILLDSHRDKPEMVRRFIEEAQIAGQLQHPGIVPVYELGAFSDRRPYFAMKLVKGQTLAHILAARTSPNDGLPRLLSIFESICQTMAYAHARGVIHRDLKPSNVMVGSFGEVQVMDWGLAKVLPRGGVVDDASAGQTKDHATVIATARSEADLDLSQPGSILGTPAYMAPEQARGEIDQVDERADVFALGSIFCELLTGQPAFTGRNGGEIQRKAARGELADAMARLDRTDYGHDSELIALCKICLAPEPEDRPKDASEIAKRIGIYHSQVQERLRKSEIAMAEEKARTEEVTKRATVERHRFRLTMALAASVLAMALMGGGGWAYVTQQRTLRETDTQRVVTKAIEKATLLWGQAKAAPIEDLSKWPEALAAANEAQSSMETGEPTPELRKRVDELLTSLENGQADAIRRAEELAKDKKLFEQLDAIRFEFADKDSRINGFLDNGTAGKTDLAYATAFRDFGIDLDQVDPTQAGNLLRKRSQPQEFAFHLDAWALVRQAAREFETVDGSWNRLLVAAQVADGDQWRGLVRSLIGGMDFEAARRLAGDESELAKQPPRSLYLLAEALEITRGHPGWSQPYLDQSIELLKRAWRMSPNDYQICRRLSREARGEFDRIRFAMAAVVAAPESLSQRQALAEALANSEGLRLLNHTEFVRAGEKAPPDSVSQLVFKHRNGDIFLIGPIRFGQSDTDTVGIRNGTIGKLMECVQLDPTSIDHHVSLAEALVRQKRYDDALKECNVIAGIDSKRRPGEIIGRALFGMGQVELAVKLIREEIEQYPNGHHDHALLGIIHYEQGRTDEAFNEFRKDFLRNAKELNYRYHKFSLKVVPEFLESIGSVDAILAIYREAMESPPHDPLFSKLFADRLLKEGRAQDAVTVYRHAIETFPDNSDIPVRLAKLLEKDGLMDEAATIYREALGRRPDDVDLHTEFIHFLKKQGNIEEENAILDKLISLINTKLQSSSHRWYPLVLARAYLARGMRDEARAQFRIYIRSEFAAVPLNQLAMELATSADADHRDGTIAVEAATKACQQTAWEAPYILDTLANAYAEFGDFESAVKWESKAIELATDEDEKEYCKYLLRMYQEKKPNHEKFNRGF